MVDSAGQQVVTSSLLQTKLCVPRARPGLVPRPGLIDRLNQGIAGKLTLVSAPAGFGKTTLLAEWLAAPKVGKGPAAWVALDQSDNEPTLFWAYVIAALTRELRTRPHGRPLRPVPGDRVADQAELRSLPGTIALARSFRAQALGDVAGTVEQARRALNLLPADDHVWRGGAALLLALAH